MTTFPHPGQEGRCRGEVKRRQERVESCVTWTYKKHYSWHSGKYACAKMCLLDLPLWYVG